MLRLRLAPITRAHILAGKGLACFASGLLTCILLLAIGVLFFDVRVSNLSVLAIAVVASCLCFVGITMMISVLGKTEEAVGGAGWGILLVAAMTGGGMIPVFIMPGWLRTLSNFSPVKWGILAIEGGIWRDFSLSDAAGPIAVLLGIGTACFLAGVIIMSRVDR
jgi:ABC-2 type transport system permease protein